jgi:hypothetical protein
VFQVEAILIYLMRAIRPDQHSHIDFNTLIVLDEDDINNKFPRYIIYFMYLHVVYLTTLSVPHTIQSRMIRWLMKNEF